MSKWTEYSDKYSALTQREKIIIALSMVFLSTYCVFILLIEAQMKELKASQKSLSQHNQSLANVQSQITDIKSALKLDPNDKVKREIKSLNQQLKAVNGRLDKTLVDYVAPNQMATELTSLLSTSNEVRVIGVTILPPSKIEIELKNGEASSDLPSYYRHGFEVIVSGDYFNLMKLVEKIIAKNNKFSVNDLNYVVTTHPIAEMTLSLVTVSDSENVIRL